MIHKSSETAQSAISYGSGFGAMTYAAITDIADYAQALTIVLACGVVAVRLIHDAVRLKRYLKGKDDGQE